MTIDSPEERSLLSAILATPDDDLPRLVYADWLEEHDDPLRAELIRLQCEIDADPEPAQAAVDRAGEITERLIESGGVRELNPNLSNRLRHHGSTAVSFYRGLIYDLTVTNDPSLTELPDWLIVQGSLRLSGTGVRAVPRALRVGKALDLSNTLLAELPDNYFHEGDLDLSGSAIATLPIGLRVGGDCSFSSTNVTDLPSGLEIGGSLITSSHISNLPADLQVKNGLYLRNSHLTEVAVRSIPTMPGLSHYSKITALHQMNASHLIHAIRHPGPAGPPNR